MQHSIQTWCSLTTAREKHHNEASVKSENQPIAAELLGLLLEQAKLSTMSGIYARLEPWSDGRIRTTLSAVATETGRLASSGRKREDWPGWEFSTNLQNLPKKTARADALYNVRQTIVPDPGMVFVEGDLSQAEIYATCLYAGDWAKINRMLEGSDEHRRLAAELYGVKPADVTPSQRAIGKASNHGCNYGLGWHTFMDKLNKEADLTGITISAKESKAAVDAFRRLNPKTVAWWGHIEREIRTKGYLTNCYGRKRIFLDREGAGNDAVAFLPQSTIADHLNISLVRAFHKLDEAGLFTILLQVHDAILGQAPEGKWRQVARVLKTTMEHPLTYEGRTVTIPADVSVSSVSWGDMKAVAL